MSAKNLQKGNVAAVAVKLAAGVQKHFASTTPIVIAEGTFTPAQIAAQLERLASLRSAVDDAKAVLKGKLEDEKKEGPALRAFYFAVITFVRVAYGGAPEILADSASRRRKPGSRSLRSCRRPPRRSAHRRAPLAARWGRRRRL